MSRDGCGTGRTHCRRLRWRRMRCVTLISADVRRLETYWLLFEQSAERTRTALEQCDPRTDIKLFVTQTGSGNSIPGVLSQHTPNDIGTHFRPPLQILSLLSTSHRSKERRDRRTRRPPSSARRLGFREWCTPLRLSRTSPTLSTSQLLYDRSRSPNRCSSNNRTILVRLSNRTTLVRLKVVLLRAARRDQTRTSTWPLPPPPTTFLPVKRLLLPVPS